MFVLFTATIAFAACLSFALAANDAVEHYTRRIVPADWSLSSTAASPMETVKFHVLLKQRNIDELERRVLAAADPSVPTYGQWLSKEEIISLVAPPKADQRRVISWLAKNNVRVESFGDALKCEAAVSAIESLFGAKLAAFERNGVRLIKVAMGETVSLPADIAQIVQFVLDITEFPVVDRVKPKLGHTPQDGQHVLPEVLQVAYSLPGASYTFSSNVSVAVAEFQSDPGFIPSDLEEFQVKNLIPKAAITHFIGPKPKTSNADLEASLDVQYVSAVAYKAQVWYYSTANWLASFATDFISAPVIPLSISLSWGWTETDQCSVGNCDFSAAKGSSLDYVTRVNAEFLKVTGRGCTIIAASGDQGAPGDGNADCTGSGRNALSALYPAASPWVTAVGATMFEGKETHGAPTPAPGPTPAPVPGPTPKPTPAPGFGTSPACKSQGCLSGLEQEVVCSYPKALITSGGGFSDYVAMPAWQAAAVHNYLKIAKDLPPASAFNATTRAYPDVSASGHAYLIKANDQWTDVDGTSCSAPVFCGVVGLLNDARLSAGKPPLGFLNPLIYQMAAAAPSAFKDITIGNNKATESCVGKYGYTAAPGWDAATGFGTPNFPNMLAYIKSLPY